MKIKLKIKVNPYLEAVCSLFDNFLISLSSGNFLDVEFLIEKNDEQIFYSIVCDEVYKGKISNLVSSFFQGYELEEVEYCDFENLKQYYWGLNKLPFNPIKRYDQFEDRFSKNFIDPLNSLMSGVNEVQNFKFSITLSSVNSSERKKLLKIFALLSKIKSLWLINFLYKLLKTTFGSILLWFKPIFDDGVVSKYHSDEAGAEAVIDKLSKNLLWVEIKSYENFELIDSYLRQFNLPYLNGFVVSNKKVKFFMSTEEVASVFHFPVNKELSEFVSNVTFLKFTTIPASVGEIKFKTANVRKQYFCDFNSRLKHTYLVGKTGMGKSTMLKSMALQDIALGNGLAVVDPHGDLVEEILKYIPSQRTNDVVYLDCSMFDYPFSFNPLYGVKDLDRSLVANNLVLIFKKIFAESWGPRLEYFLKNFLLFLLNVKNPTLIMLPKLLTDMNFLKKQMEFCNDLYLIKFLEEEFLVLNVKLRQEIVTPILNKIGGMLLDPVLRNVFGIYKAKLNFEFLMRTKKIVLLNLAKGKIGALNSFFIGSLFITTFLNASYKQAEYEYEQRIPFYLYVDEFHNFATQSFSECLSESRKYKLGLILANQYLSQIDVSLQEAILGNIANLIVYQVNPSDAELFYKQFREVVPQNCFVNLPEYTNFAMMNNHVLNLYPCFECDFQPQNKNLILSESKIKYNLPIDVVEKKLSTGFL